MLPTHCPSCRSQLKVKCMKCEQCGEVVLSAATVEKIERILQTVEKAVAEITVVNYPDCAA